ncbi:DNA-directed RNA polymerase I subunit RPA34.5-domain-containing protein [Talaromyces proteolyticus]|uniref:DNA-directed RNA polymerase I subunit RPA34.5-domain-containing protein n=1 Tax=Talaromyces proteolyticus TaxID=1131652 RepID=A0AAD4KIG0_9EURO|nr:DNA-directed RNA polymerase I subunit RPA34.5-domain-containing protein [Talaromyces proteolyticus]KAH8692993.1 DNA-directed RNA polymerase I subunit RPA34.5-domain-containing protein [Talaromyces proteolyticus]
MGKLLSEEVVVSDDSDESMESAPEAETTAADRSSSDSESDSGSSSGSESEEDTNDKPSNIKRTARSTAFVPPAGFKASKSKTRPTSSASSALSNLEGKQIFHIAAPSFLPLSKIREITLEKALHGEPVLTHQGVDYGIPADAQQKQGTQALMVYDEKTDAYVRKDIKKIQSYTFQELVRLPGQDALHVQAPQDTQRPARPQPKHLKMRFHPVGSGNIPAETVGSSSESEADEPAFRVPSGQHKRKAEGVEGSEKKKTKNIITSSQASSGAGERERGDAKKKSSKHRNETSQERRARKEDRKKRKTEKK